MLLDVWISRRMRLGAGGTATGTVIAIAGVALALAVMELTLGIVVGLCSLKHMVPSNIMYFHHFDLPSF